jgi:parallel beta-helix repeat protein
MSGFRGPVQDQGGAVYHVRAYASMQAAVDAANAAGGGIVDGGQSAIALSAALTGRSNVLIRNVTLTLAPGYSATSVVTFATRSRAGLENVSIDATNGAASLNQVVAAYTCTDLTLRGLHIHGATKVNASAVLLDRGERLVVEGCEFYDCHRGITAAALAVGAAQGLMIRDNHVHNCSAFGVYVTGSADYSWDTIDISGNTVHDIDGDFPRYPIYTTTGTDTRRHSNVRIADNRVTGLGLAFGAAGVGEHGGSPDLIAAYSLKDAVITGNDARLGGDGGIVLDNCEGVSVVGNVSAYNNLHGVLVDRSRDVTISGNLCYNNFQNFGSYASAATPRGGITLASTAQRVVTAGNRCFNVGTATQIWGITIQAGAEDCHATGDHCDSNVTGPYYVDGAAVRCTANVLTNGVREQRGEARFARTGSDTAAVAVRAVGDTYDRMELRPSGLRFGSGTAATDVILRRLGAFVGELVGSLAIGTADVAAGLGRLAVFTSSAASHGITVRAAASQTGTLFRAQDSDGNTRTYVDHYGVLRPPSLSTTARDALTAENSMVIYNTTTSKLQVRAGGAWVDLH